MKFDRLSSGLAVFALALQVSAPLRAQQGLELLAVTWDGQCVRIDAATGTATVIGPTGRSGLNSLAVTPDGGFITANDANYGPSRLWRIDPVLGTTTQLHIPFLNSIRALAHGDDDQFYAIDNLNGSTASRLYRLDLSAPQGSTTVRTLLAQMTFEGSNIALQSLAVSPEGELFAWRSTQGLVRINAVTGAITDVDGQWGNPEDIQTLAFTPDGRLFGMRHALFELDRETGRPTQIGPGFSGLDIRGAEFLLQGPVKYCVPSVNSLACRPVLSHSGTPSATAPDGFVLSAAPFLNQRSGLLMYSLQGAAQAPFHGVTLCLVSPARARPLLDTGGDALPASTCSGSLEFDFNTFVSQATQLGAGTTVWAQFLARDPLADGGYLLSDAARFELGP